MTVLHMKESRMPDEHDRTPEAYPDPATTTPERVLLIQAHPDDAEFSCSGTIAKWAKDGAEIHYCSITSGDKGSSDPEMTGPTLATMREAEQRCAAEILGVKSVTFLGYQDAMLVPDLNLRRELVRVMRRIRPTALVCQDPTMRYIGREYINHPDHIAAGEASLAAVFPSVRDRMTFPELLAEGLEPHVIPSVYIFGTTVPDCWIDISDTIETKLKALLAHASQVGEEGAEEIVKVWGRRDAERHPEKPEGFGEYAETFKYMHIG
jgi:LmbE family N-acetylglucosaminyl deacetylase